MELRELTLNDVEELLKITCHPEVTKYTPNVIQDRDTLVSWLKNKPSTDREYMILLDERVIGECSLDEKSGDIGIMLYPEYWRQGYGTAAVKQLLQMAEDAGLDEVSAQTDRRNEACITLLEGVDFVRCGMGWSLSEDVLEKTLNDLQEILIFKRSLGKESGGKYMSERVATVWRILRSVMCVGGLTITPNNPSRGRKQKEKMEWKMILN